jgi:hypothetical protein
LTANLSLVTRLLKVNQKEKLLMTPTRLSDDQIKAVLSESRYNRIIADAGKTETLT